jgi:hypothetical protein
MLQASHLLSLCILIFRFGIYVGPWSREAAEVSRGII